MSFEFMLPGAQLPAQALGPLLRAAGEHLDVQEPDGAWPPGLRHVFQRGVSTRCVEVSADADGVGVRILTCSSPEDYEMAIALVQAAASLADVREVVPEDRSPIAPAEVPSVYGQSWATAEIRSAATVLASLVEQHAGKTLSLDGPNRAFLFGVRLLAELHATGPPHEFADRLVAAMRRTQWPGECFAANVLQVGDRSGTETTRVAVLSPNSRTLLPNVDLVALHDPDSRGTYVPAEAVVALLPGHASYLDEGHVLVEAVPTDEWSAMLLRAADIATDLP